MPFPFDVRTRWLLISALAVVATAAACGGDSASAPGDGTAAPGSISGEFTRPGPALDVVGISDWINSEPLSIQGLLNENKVVLVDFWTYTCVNCLRTFPFLRAWHEKYSDRGLVILGVHSPEFEFEKVLSNVIAAAEKDGVIWPIALDSEMDTWNAFGNRFWPAKYMFTPEGGLTYTHFGEGAYIETEKEIRNALEEAGWDLSGIPVGTVDDAVRDPEADGITRELYGGYERGYNAQGVYAGNEAYYTAPDQTQEYLDPGEYPPQQYFLHGLWTNTAESIVHARETEELTDYIVLSVLARSTNVVIQPQGPEPFAVYVTLEDKPLLPEEAGDDIEYDEQGRSLFRVDAARMYRIVELPVFGERILKLSSTSDNFAMFAFTFGINESGF